MGEQNVGQPVGEQTLRSFTKALLDDVKALGRMIDEGRLGCDVRRIGAEQEVFLVNKAYQPVNLAQEMMRELGGAPFTTELAQFNLEVNLAPQELKGAGLMRMEDELRFELQRATDTARRLDSSVVLAGILPTLSLDDLTLDSMTPVPRYRQLNDVLTELAGGSFRTHIKGTDELEFTHENVMLEACNTSFQVHFQVAASEFARLYNLAQAVTGPVLAAAVNSPVLLQHRLWKETRVALFQQSLDARSQTHKARGRRQRVSFGDRWVENSILEIYREDIARYRVLLADDLGESSTELLDRGITPPLRALCLHNGTVYRWNRPCYGVKDGVPHVRIEARTLPAGPTVIDEIANAAFFFGLLSALAEEYGDITKVMDFDDARSNFVSAARYGLKAQFNWINGTGPVTARDLILNTLLPQAREGLVEQKVDGSLVDRYLGVIEERVRSGRTGSQWALDSMAAMGQAGTRDARYRELTASIADQQQTGEPVHTWELARLEASDHWRESYRTVAQVMTTDLFTVHPEDLVDLAASLMDWEHLRHVPVEDNEGHLVGLVSHRSLLRLVGRGSDGDTTAVAVKEIMRPDPVTVSPETSTIEALERMREHRVSCLPVVQDGKLAGIVSEGDFLGVAAKLLDQWLREDG